MWVKVTPRLAKQWLSCRSGIQRNINKDHVARLAKMMADGNWREHAGGVICFDDRGELLDGQHRLQAVIDSGTTQMFRVDDGCTRDDFKAMDDGLCRQVSQFIDAKNASTVAAIANYVAGLRGGILTTNNRADRASVLAIYEEDPEGFTWAAASAVRIRKLLGKCPTKYVGGVLYMLSLGHADVDGFVTSLVDTPHPNALIVCGRIGDMDLKAKRQAWQAVIYYLYRCHETGTEPSRRPRLGTWFRKYEDYLKEVM